jgi:tRNA threonylcarbamoyladenosine biosynthesis protein TsaB
MALLALETTSAHGSIALIGAAGEVLAVMELEAGSYSTTLFGAALGLAAGAGVELAAMEAFAVATGPGSFTGVRLGLTAVKGLAEVWKKPAIPVSTLAAVAASAEMDCPAIAALDASRGEVYFGIYPQGALAYCIASIAAENAGKLSSFTAGEIPSQHGKESLARAGDFVALRRKFGELPLLTPHTEVAGLFASEAGSSAVVSPALAPAVGRLGLELLRLGRVSDPLRLDANYIRRSDAEIISLPLLRRR